MNRQKDKILSQKLKKQGVSETEFYHFKLYNPNTYDKLIQQADINADVAVNEYKGIIKSSNKRV